MFILSVSGFVPNPKFIKPADPLIEHKSRINAEKRKSLLRHITSQAGKSQTRIVFDIFRAHPEGLTDKEVYQIVGIFPSTVSARRNDIDNAKEGEFNIWIFKTVLNPDGLAKIRDGGRVHRLERII
jgi:hypothetical protein